MAATSKRTATSTYAAPTTTLAAAAPTTDVAVVAFVPPRDSTRAKTYQPVSVRPHDS